MERVGRPRLELALRSSGSPLNARSIAAAGVCVAVLSSCGSISSDIRSAKTEAMNAGLHEAQQEIRELSSRVDSEPSHSTGTGGVVGAMNGIGLKRPHGVNEKEWLAAIRKDLNEIQTPSPRWRPLLKLRDSRVQQRVRSELRADPAAQRLRALLAVAVG